MPFTGDFLPFRVFSREQVLAALDRSIARHETFLAAEESRPVYEAAVQALGVLKIFREELEKEP